MNINFFGNINMRIEDMEAKVADLEDIEELGEELEISRIKFEERQLTRDNMLRQQSRILWLKNGERNSKFFTRLFKGGELGILYQIWFV